MSGGESQEDERGESARLDALFGQVRLAANGSSYEALQGAIATLVDFLTAHPHQAEEVLAAAILLMDDKQARAANALLLALGRCSNESVLRVAVTALDDARTDPRIRESLVVSLAQRREREISHRVGMSWSVSDTVIDAPISERFVVDAIARIVERAADPASSLGGQLLFHAAYALGPTAATDDAALRLLDSLLRQRPSHAPLVLRALRLGEQSPAIEGIARRVLESSSPLAQESYQAALELLLRQDSAAGLRTAAEVLDDKDASGLRKLAVLQASASVGAIAPRDVSLCESLLQRAQFWVGRTPRVFIRRQRTAGPEDQPDKAQYVETLPALENTVNTLLVRVGRLSHPVRVAAATALARKLAAASIPLRNVRRTVRSGVSSGGPEYVDALLDAIAAEPIPAARFVVVLEVSKQRLSATDDWAALQPRIRDTIAAYPSAEQVPMLQLLD